MTLINLLHEIRSTPNEHLASKEPDISLRVFFLSPISLQSSALNIIGKNWLNISCKVCTGVVNTEVYKKEKIVNL